MYTSPFSINSLKSVTRAGDSGRHNINLDDDLDSIALAAQNGVNNNSVDLTHRIVTTRKGHELYLLSNYNTILILRATAKAIADQYRIRTMSRDAIVRGVLESLFDATPSYMTRCDFSSFYENLEIAPIVSEILSNTRTHPQVKSVLHELNNAGILTSATPGIPRGLGLSAILSELRLLAFDHKVRSLQGVYRYFRFADDFIIFSTNPHSEILAGIKEITGKDLCLNAKKTKELKIESLTDSEKNPCTIEPKDMSFLGYQFIISQGMRRGHPRQIRVTLSKDKLAKRKMRVILSLKDFIKNKNSELLLRRIQLLTGNIKIRRTGHAVGPRNAHVNTGIYYSYKACGTYRNEKNRPVKSSENSIQELKQLDGFLHSLLWRVSSEFQRDVQMVLSSEEIGKLKKYSFNKGFEKKMELRITRAQAHEARKVWMNA